MCAEFGEAPLTTSVPLLTVVGPEYVLVPAMVMVPRPFLLKPPVPLITPCQVVLLPVLPAVKLAVPSQTCPPMLAGSALPSCSEPMVWL